MVIIPREPSTAIEGAAKVGGELGPDPKRLERSKPKRRVPNPPKGARSSPRSSAEKKLVPGIEAKVSEKDGQPGTEVGKVRS